MKPGRAVDAQNGGVEAQNRAVKGACKLVVQVRITLMRSRFRTVGAHYGGMETHNGAVEEGL